MEEPAIFRLHMHPMPQSVSIWTNLITVPLGPADLSVQHPTAVLISFSQLFAAPTTLTVEMVLWKILLRSVMMGTPVMMMIVSLPVLGGNAQQPEFIYIILFLLLL